MNAVMNLDSGRMTYMIYLRVYSLSSLSSIRTFSCSPIGHQRKTREALGGNEKALLVESV